MQFAKTHKHALKRSDMAQSELESASKQIKVLESRCQAAQQEHFEAQEESKKLAGELAALRTEAAETQTLQRDGYEREERIHKKNQ